MLLDIAYYVTLAVAVIFVGIPLLLFAMILVTGLWFALNAPRERREAIAKLSTTKCPACGMEFGLEEATHAEKAGSASSRDRHQNSRKRYICTRSAIVWPVNCPNCHRDSWYSPTDGRLGLITQISLAGVTEKEIALLSRPQLEALILTGEWLPILMETTPYSTKLAAHKERLCVELPEYAKNSSSYFGGVRGFFDQLAQQLGLTEIEWTIPAPHVVEPQKKPRPDLVREGFDVLDVPGLGQCFRRTDPVGRELTEELQNVIGSLSKS